MYVRLAASAGRRPAERIAACVAYLTVPDNGNNSCGFASSDAKIARACAKASFSGADSTTSSSYTDSSACGRGNQSCGAEIECERRDLAPRPAAAHIDLFDLPPQQVHPATGAATIQSNRRQCSLTHSLHACRWWLRGCAAAVMCVLCSRASAPAPPLLAAGRATCAASWLEEGVGAHHALLQLQSLPSLQRWPRQLQQVGV